MEKTYVMPDDKAKELKERITSDFNKAYFELFPIVKSIIIDILTSIEKKLPFTYEQDCTLRANGYTKGVVADWYYPHWDNGCNIIRKK